MYHLTVFQLWEKSLTVKYFFNNSFVKNVLNKFSIKINDI